VARIIAGYLGSPESSLTGYRNKFKPCLAGYRNNLEPCLTVCKAWRSLYLLYFWREVRAGLSVGWMKHIPFFDPVYHGHYRKFVQVLTVHHDFSFIDQLHDYQNLRLLRLRHVVGHDWSRLKDPDLEEFINRHPLLECLDLRFMPTTITDPVWTALLGHSRLEKIILECEDPLPDDF
ncbi:hypothetical protein BGZ98_007985, partial [Dissophora globulifera]